MTSDEAEMYTKAVALEYERLQLEDFEESVMAEKRQYPQVPQDMEIFGQDSLPDFYPHPRQDFGNDERYAPEYYSYPTGYINPEDQISSQEVQGNPADINPYAFVAALFSEAYGKGNEEAQEIVKMLSDRVSQDDNPNDMAQIKDLLVQTIAESMNEEPEVNEIQSVNSEAQVPLDVEEKLTEAKAHVVEQIKEEKQQKQENPSTQIKEKNEKVQKETVQAINKPDQGKQ